MLHSTLHSTCGTNKTTQAPQQSWGISILTQCCEIGGSFLVMGFAMGSSEVAERGIVMHFLKRPEGKSTVQLLEAEG